MDSWRLIKEILKGADFYWKKFLIFSLTSVIIIASLFIWQNQKNTQAEFAFSNEAQFSSISQKVFNIEVKNNGQVLIDGADHSSDFKIYQGYYEIRAILLDVPGTYIDQVSVKMTLPNRVRQDQVEQIVYAIHGIGSYDKYMQDSQTLIYEARDISPESTLSIVARLPKDSLKPPLGKLIFYWVTNIPVEYYTIGAGVIPIVTLIVMLFMIIKRRKDQIVSFKYPSISAPPAALPPAIPGVLIDGQIGAREIAATLIDLANRGYIYIIGRQNHFTFGKRKSLDLNKLPDLRDYERILLSKIFEKQNYKSTKDDVQMRVGRHIFSRKIAKVFLEIYNETTSLGYFINNPAVVHRRWRFTGITLFFVGILGFIQSALWAPDPKFTLIFWAGEIGASFVIIKLSGLMPTRSALGSRALNQWMAFRRYLRDSAPFRHNDVDENLFNKFLPYAIVFGVEAEWAKRFMKTSFAKPDWYESYEFTPSLEKYISGLYPIIGFVGEVLAGSHDPTVE